MASSNAPQTVYAGSGVERAMKVEFTWTDMSSDPAIKKFPSGGTSKEYAKINLSGLINAIVTEVQKTDTGAKGSMYGSTLYISSSPDQSSDMKISIK